MKNARQVCKTSNLSESLCRQLNLYALSASAAGVSVLAIAQPSEAKVVYTPANETIGLHHKIFLDLNHDGREDFVLKEEFFTTTSVDENHSIVLSVKPAVPNRIWGMGRFASALAEGVEVGPNGQFSTAGGKAMAVDYYADGTGGSGTCAGPWNNVTTRYLGFSFTIHATRHFGWARMNVSCVTTFGSHRVKGKLTGYAYETIVNKPIITGKTEEPDVTVYSGTLGTLATGRK